jgi:uncharacterized membrane protein
MSVSRPLLIGLIASAALNVFLIGGIAGVTYVRLTAPEAAPVSDAAERTGSAGPESAAAPPVVAPVSPPAATDPGPQASPSDVTAPARSSDKPVRAVTSRPASTPAPAVSPSDQRAARAPIWTAGEQLSPENRVALRQTLRAVNQKNQPIVRQARQERRSALQALSTPGADPADVARRLANARALEQEARTNVESALAAFAATLPPAERAALAEGLQQIYAAQGREQGGREPGGARPGRQ